MIEDGTFKDIYDKAVSKNVTTYRIPLDIVQYYCVVHAHINDDKYVALRQSVIKYTQEEVEIHLRNLFPELYTILVDSLYYYAIDERTTTSIAFKKLLPRL